jgi:hypothetical protein
MSERRRDKKPRFPRKQWQPGQQERVENPKKGKGTYRRTRTRREVDNKMEETLDGKEPQPPPKPAEGEGGA